VALTPNEGLAGAGSATGEVVLVRLEDGGQLAR
jgi:hypothetical protein